MVHLGPVEPNITCLKIPNNVRLYSILTDWTSLVIVIFLSATRITHLYIPNQGLMSFLEFQLACSFAIFILIPYFQRITWKIRDIFDRLPWRNRLAPDSTRSQSPISDRTVIMFILSIGIMIFVKSLNPPICLLLSQDSARNPNYSRR